MRKRWIILVLVAGAVAWGVSNRRAERRRELRGMVASAVSLKGKLLPLAGMSATGNIKVRRLSTWGLGEDAKSPEYHRFANRCGACHAPPAPDLHRAADWPAIVERMHSDMQSAGTMGLLPADREAVLRFLGRHAAQ